MGVRALVVMVVLLLGRCVDAADWAAVIPTAHAHLARVEAQIGETKSVCSSVVFDVDSDGVALALTAGHCVDRAPTEKFDLTLNDRHATVLEINRLLDLAIVQFRAHKETPIALAKDSPPTGTEVAVVGFAFGVEEVVAQFGRVAQSYNRETKALWINADLAFGDSGGPLIDEQGRLVGINSRIYSGGLFGQMAHLGAAVRIESVQDFIAEFRDHQKRLKKGGDQ
jgi:S1-C subfamily serine protease